MNDKMSLSSFQKELSITPRSQTKDSLELQIKGIDAPFMNALRRTMLDDVSTIAIDKVIMYQNTSVMNDEVLVHRLGLIPIQADPELFEFKTENGSFGNKNCVKFKLQVKCDQEHNNQEIYGKLGETDRLNVYASDFVIDQIFHKDSEIHSSFK